MLACYPDALCDVIQHSGALDVSFTAMEAMFIIPPSVNIRMLTCYAGFLSDDPLCETVLSFYHVENLLTLDDNASLRVCVQNATFRAQFEYAHRVYVKDGVRMIQSSMRGT
jgi:hypothetical protein